MLTPSSAAVVQSTLPAVRAHAEMIATKFYNRMFAAHPELLDLFNRGNQATGRQRQALAGSVVAYAEHLVGAGTAPLAALVERIAHKHVSVGIAPSQYPIVGRHLMAAVADVLGDAVTPDVARAWDEVYWLFACELVAREARLYHEVGVADPARLWRDWRVLERITETTDVISLVLAPVDGSPAPTFTAGQYASVAVSLDGGRGRQIRQYSLSGRPGAPTWQLTIKRVRGTATSPDGMVSTFLHEHVEPGDVLALSPPVGDVSSVVGDGPLVLITAGIGVTPAMSALEHLAQQASERPVVHVHADRTSAAHALRQHLPRLSTSLPQLRFQFWYEDGKPETDVSVPASRTEVNPGRVDPDRIPLPPDASCYLCGPLPFMNEVRAGLLRRGVPSERIACEVFGPEMLRVGGGQTAL